MHNRNRTLRVGALIAIAAVCVGLAGCGGSSSGDAVRLLHATFCGAHKVTSGNLNVGLTITPSGSRTLKGPISLSLSGPFQSLGPGKLPASDFTVALGALGSSASVGIISTGHSGYVTLQGTSYQLPQASFQRLESNFSKFATPPSCGSQSNPVSKLHISPLHWLSNPQVVGTENVGGANTTHIQAGINVSALVSDFSTLLKKSSSLGLPGNSGLSNGIPQSTLNSIASEIQNTSFDVWTGTSDKTLRRLRVHLTLPVTGQFSTLLGGLSSADIAVSMQYGDLNQPQKISAPASTAPYSQFQSKLRAFVLALRTAVLSAVSGGLTSGGTSGGGATGSTGGATGSGGSTAGGNYQAYSKCIQTANGNVAKMQQCAPLLNGGQ